jgi:hypothetical protein
MWPQKKKRAEEVEALRYDPSGISFFFGSAPAEDYRKSIDPAEMALLFPPEKKIAEEPDLDADDDQTASKPEDDDAPPPPPPE